MALELRRKEVEVITRQKLTLGGGKGYFDIAVGF